MAKMDYARVKVEVGEVCVASEPIMVCHGFKEYKVMMFPAISGEDFNLILNLPLGRENEKVVSCNDSLVARLSSREM